MASEIAIGFRGPSEGEIGCTPNPPVEIKPESFVMLCQFKWVCMPMVREERFNAACVLVYMAHTAERYKML